MKKSLLIAIVIIATAITANAQRFAYVNTDYILENIPEYKAAQEQIDKITAEWRTEADKKQKEIDELYRNFQNEQYLLTEEQKKAKIAAAIERAKAMKAAKEAEKLEKK